jgi:hypothetical protein
LTCPTRRAEQYDEFTLIDIEIHFAKRMHSYLADNIDLGQAAGVEDSCLRVPQG